MRYYSDKHKTISFLILHKRMQRTLKVLNDKKKELVKPAK